MAVNEPAQLVVVHILETESVSAVLLEEQVIAMVLRYEADLRMPLVLDVDVTNVMAPATLPDVNHPCS